MLTPAFLYFPFIRLKFQLNSIEKRLSPIAVNCPGLTKLEISVIFTSDSRRETGRNNEECTERASQPVYRSMSFTQPRKRIPKVGHISFIGFISVQTHFVQFTLSWTSQLLPSPSSSLSPLKILKQFIFISAFLFIYQEDKKVEDNDSFYKRRRRTVCSFLEQVNMVHCLKSLDIIHI